MGFSIGDYLSSSSLLQSVNEYYTPLSELPISNLPTDSEDDFLKMNHDTLSLLDKYASYYGLIQDKTLSVSITRDHIFTKKPALASDTGGAYKSFVFFTRPNLNLLYTDINGELKPIDSLYNAESLISTVITDPLLYSELCRDGCMKSNLFYLLSNYVKECQPPKFAETERPAVKNMFGISTKVTGFPEYHGVDIAFTFTDNYRGDVAKLFHMISDYKHHVSKRGYPMRSEYIRNRADDTLISCYIVTTTNDLEVIGFGVGINGVIEDTPTHFTQHNIEGFSKEELLDNFSININFGTYYAFAPKYFNIFNNLFGFDPGNIVDVRGRNRIFHIPKTSRYKVATDVLKFSGTETLPNINNYSFSSTGDSSYHINNSNYVMYGTNNINKDMFRYTAKSPGIYTAKITNSSGSAQRAVYKLGFST